MAPVATAGGVDLMKRQAVVLGVCGLSGSGKTTLIEAVLPMLRAKGLSVAVLKHGCHEPDIDRPGKDSDRFFQAGADVYLESGEILFTRLRKRPEYSVCRALAMMSPHYDVILVEGHKASADFDKIWLDPDGGGRVKDAARVIMSLPRDGDRAGVLMGILAERLAGREA